MNNEPKAIMKLTHEAREQLCNIYRLAYAHGRQLEEFCGGRPCPENHRHAVGVQDLLARLATMSATDLAKLNEALEVAYKARLAAYEAQKALEWANTEVTEMLLTDAERDERYRRAILAEREVEDQERTGHAGHCLGV